jgi:predicted acylesterase/phospholipase RssA
MKRLVFSGGGTQVLVFLPSLKEMEQRGYLQEVKEWWGTSAGALMAALFAVSRSAEKTTTIMMKWDYTRFRDVNLMNLFQLTEVWGLDDGSCLLREVEAMLEEASPGASKHLLSDVPGLSVFVSDLTTHSTLRISAATHGSLRLSEVIRASMTFPILICPYKHTVDRHVWVDGGIRANFAWDHLSDQEREESLGFYLQPTWINGPMTFFDYISSLVHFDEPAKSKQWMARWKQNVLCFPTPPYPVWYVRIRPDDRDLLESLSLATFQAWLTTWTSRTPQRPQQSVPLRIPAPTSPEGRTDETLGTRECPSPPQPSHPSRDSHKQIPPLSRRWSL